MIAKDGLRVVIITQDEPFFLPEVIPRLFQRIGGCHTVEGCILLAASPFGKKESFVQKALKTYRIFGARFFLRYALRFLGHKLTAPNAMEHAFRARGVDILRLQESINTEDSLARIRALNPDILVSIAGNEIFRRPLIDLAPKGCLNLHTALLPKYRGLMPTFWVLKNKEKETGVSVFLVDEGIDSGPIVVQKCVKIGEQSQEELIRLTKKIGMDSIAEALDIMAGPDPVFIENDPEQASYFTFPTSQDVAAFRKGGARF